MIVFEIVVPGTWLNYEERSWAAAISNHLASLESQFYCANVALNLFQQSQTAESSAFDDRQLGMQDSQRRREIQVSLEHQFGENLTFSQHDEIRFMVEAQFNREQWASGRLPKEFERNLSFIYAREFLYSFHNFSKFLKVLSEELGVPPTISQLYKQLLDLFPDLSGVRNTVQHLEDRVRGLGRGSKPLALKSVSNRIANAPTGGLLLINVLNGTRYGSTMADGNYGEIDLSEGTMIHLQNILQCTLNAFEWQGPRRFLPSV